MKRFFFAALILLSSISASAMTDDELKEMTATIINLNGYLCAFVISISPTLNDEVYRVSCVEYRDGSGSATYLMNARTAEVIKE